MNIVSVFEVLLVSLSRSLKTINNMKNSGFTFRKRLASFRYAFNGIRLLIQKEHNAWIHCFAAICVVIAGFFFGLSQTEWIAVVIVIGAVLSAEAINSSIESLAFSLTRIQRNNKKNERPRGRSRLNYGNSSRHSRIDYFFP